jgi:hypothetical protein
VVLHHLLALAGVVLLTSSNDRGETVFIVNRWSLTKQLDTIADVERWLPMVTGEPHGANQARGAYRRQDHRTRELF